MLFFPCRAFWCPRLRVEGLGFRGSLFRVNVSGLGRFSLGCVSLPHVRFTFKCFLISCMMLATATTTRH